LRLPVPGDDSPDGIGNQRPGDPAGFVQPLQTKDVLVGGDLHHAVGRGVEDRLAGAQMFLAEPGDDLGAAGVAVAEHAWQAGF